MFILSVFIIYSPFINANIFITNAEQRYLDENALYGESSAENFIMSVDWHIQAIKFIAQKFCVADEGDTIIP